MGREKSDRKCSVQNCGRPHFCRGVCSGHHTQLRRGLAFTPIREKYAKVCSVLECEKKHNGKGFCVGHLRQQEAGLAIAPLRQKYDSVCTVPGCEQGHHAKGLCGGHYLQSKVKPPFAPLQKKRAREYRGCSQQGCVAKHYGKGLCKRHYGQKGRGVECSETPNFEPLCYFSGCGVKRAAKGLCLGHYQQKSRGIELMPIKRHVSGCTETGCTDKHFGNGYCYRHWEADKKARDIVFRIQKNIRSRLRAAILNGQKRGSAVRDLGCSIPELKKYIEARFEPGMSWDNWAIDTWHIDHYIPLISFRLTDRGQFLSAVHHTNLQPLWAAENLKKSDLLLYGPLPAPYGWVETTAARAQDQIFEQPSE